MTTDALARTLTLEAPQRAAAPAPAPGEASAALWARAADRRYELTAETLCHLAAFDRAASLRERAALAAAGAVPPS
jgi:hypothetical protein